MEPTSKDGGVAHEVAPQNSARAATPVEPVRDGGQLDEVRVAAAVTIQRLFRCRHARKQFREMLNSVFAKFYDEESGQYYYHNARTGKTTWEKPKLLKGDEDVSVAGVYAGGKTADEEEQEQPAKGGGDTQLEDASGEENEGEDDDENDGEDGSAEGEDGEDEVGDGGDEDEAEERDAMGYTAKERELVKAQFDHYDADKSGSISAKELLKLMQTLGEQLTLANVQDMIKQVDTNSNGEVEFDEFLQILRRQKDKNQYSASLELALFFGPKELENLKRQFMKLDLDASGFIDENEIQALIKKLGRRVEEFDLQAMLLEVDADGSGSIGFNEFLQIVASMMKEGGKRSAFAMLLDLGIAQGILNELNDVMLVSKTKIHEWWNADMIAEQKRLEAKRERRRKQEEERRRQQEQDRAAFEEHEAQLAAERAARMAKVDGLEIRIEFAGDGLNYPVPGQYVRVHYTGMFEKGGEVFESTRKRGGALEFCVGAGHLIKGFDLALQRMSVGETSRVTMAPMLAYGVKGRPPKIPPNATLVFKIELISIKEKLHLAQDLGGGDDD